LFARESSTGIVIAAPAARVWEVLTDFASYPEWNPMIRRAEGGLRVGERLTVRFEPEGNKGHTFKPRLTVVEPGRELRWLGWPRLPGLLDTDHYWLLEPAPGGTRLVHGGSVFGLLAPLAGRGLVEKTRQPFEAMNRAMQQRAESM
jgi:hypothetical protein